jgi:hypothetical protein
MSIQSDESRIGQALHDLVPPPPTRPDLFEQVATRARRGTRYRMAGAGLALALIATCGYLLVPGRDAGAVTPAAGPTSVLGCIPWPPPTGGNVNLTPAEKDPVTGKVTYPAILMPPVDPGLAAICEQLVPLVTQHPGLVSDPRALATAVHSAVNEMYTVRIGLGEMHTGPVAGDTIRRDAAGRWTTQLPGHPCPVEKGSTGTGHAVYHGDGADIRITVHRDGCWAWAEVRR